MFSRLYQFYASRVSSLSLFQKLTLKTMLIAVVPMIVISALFLHQANRIILSETAVSNERAFSQTAAMINSDIQANKRALSTYVSMPQIIETLASDPAEKGVFEQAMDLRDLINDSLIINLTDSVYRLRLYVNDAFFYARERVNAFPLSDIADEPWYTDIERYPFVYIPIHNQFYIYNNSQDIVSIAARVQTYRENNKTVGVGMIDISVDSLRAMLEKQAASSDNALCIVDADGAIVTYTAGGGATFTSGMLEEITARPAHAGQTSSAALGAWHLQWTELEIPGWRIIEAIPLQRMAAGRNLLAFQMALILLIVIPLVSMIALFTSRAFSGRVSRIAKAVKQYAGGASDTRLTVSSSDVLGSFEYDVNLLFDRMNRMVAEQYSLGQQARNADMNALQSQINPHFLYNTLDMLYWMAKSGEYEVLPDVIIALSGFYRKSLARGQEIVRVRDELEHIRFYMEIQNHRFSGAIETRWDIDETLLEAPMLKLTLQPIVENAVQHGIGRSPSRSGCVGVSLRRDGPDMFIDVTDDGAGMTREQAALLTRGVMDEGEGGRSYGIYNVQKRIRLLYGDVYGLSYQTEPGRGTRVTVRLPVDRPCSG